MCIQDVALKTEPRTERTIVALVEKIKRKMYEIKVVPNPFVLHHKVIL